MIDRGIYLVTYNGPGFTENDGTHVTQNALKVGQTIRSFEKRDKDYRRYFDGNFEFEILARIHDRDAIDAIEKMVTNQFSQNRLKSGKGGTKEWLSGVNRNQIINALNDSFSKYYDIATLPK